MSTELYIPQGCKALSDVSGRPQIRLGLQGFPKVGKTFAALTFPNVVVLSLDRGLGAHIGRTDVHEVPFYDGKFVDSIFPRTKSSGPTPNPPNKKDAIHKWLVTEALKLTSNQTLVIDGITGIEAAHDTQYNLEPFYTDKGKLDGFGLYKSKNPYFADLGDAIKALNCDVVSLCHETEKDDRGIRPLLEGQAGDKLASHYTDWFRCMAFAKPKTQDQWTKAIEFFGVPKATIEEWCSYSTNDTIYLWQTTTDNLAKCGASSLVNPPKFIPAHYASFEKYRRKQTV